MSNGQKKTLKNKLVEARRSSQSDFLGLGNDFIPPTKKGLF